MKVFRSVTLTTFSFLCSHHLHPSISPSGMMNFPSSQTNSVPIKRKLPSPILPAPGTPYSTFCLYEFDGSGDLA